MVTKAPQACTLQFQEKKEGNRGSSNLQRKKRKTMHLKGLRMLSWEKYSKLRKRWWKRTGPNKENGTFSRRLLRVVLLSNYFNSIRGKLYLWALSWTQKKILSYRFNLSKEGGTRRFPIGLKKAISKDRIYWTNLRMNQLKNKKTCFMCHVSDHRRKLKTKKLPKELRLEAQPAARRVSATKVKAKMQFKGSIKWTQSIQSRHKVDGADISEITGTEWLRTNVYLILMYL